MIKNYLLITIRSLMKNKLFIFINIFGLSLSIGCCIVAYFNWEYDATFNHNHVNRDQIYRISSVREFQGETKLFPYAPVPLGEVVRKNIPDAKRITRLSRSYSNFKIEDNLFPGGLYYADPDFFQIFSYEFINGNPADLKDKSKVFLSDEMALKLYGSTDIVGKMLTQVLDSTLKEFTVGGVFKKQPANSSFDGMSFANYDNYYDDDREVTETDWKQRNSLFIQVEDPTRIASIKSQLLPYRENNNKVREDFQIKEYEVETFNGMPQRDRANDRWFNLNGSAPTAAVISPSIMAILVLLIACFNLTNTTIAISSRRLKEIGIRKVMGGMRLHLISQFIGETLFICFVALVIGLFLGEVLLGAWNALWVEMKLASHYLDNPGFLVFLIGVLLFTAILAGSYPAFYISHFEPVSILKGKTKFGGTNYFTRALLVLQYSISLTAVVCAIAFYHNSLFQRDFDLGFDQHGTIISYLNGQNEFETYRNSLKENPAITSIAGSKHSVWSSRYNDPIKFESKQQEVDIIDVGDEYLKTMGMELIEGRDFIKDSESDRKESVIVSEKLAKSFGWDKPLGKEIIWLDTNKLYVVGVIRNVYTEGLWREMDPLMIRYTEPKNYTHLIVSTTPDKLVEVNKFMEDKWKEVFPNRLYNGRMLHVELSESATVNENIIKMFVFLGAIALMLSATGLFSLVSLNIIKKMKEIGVRKVLGASVSNITRIINTEFVVMLLIASALGCYLSYMMANALMDSIWDYYQPTSIITFVVSVVLLFTVSGLTIGFKVYSAATTNPVNTLRTE